MTNKQWFVGKILTGQKFQLEYPENLVVIVVHARAFCDLCGVKPDDEVIHLVQPVQGDPIEVFGL